MCFRFATIITIQWTPKLKADGRKPLLPEYQAVIIDEAHKLDQAAVQTYSTVIDFEQIDSAGQRTKTEKNQFQFEQTDISALQRY